MTVEDKIVCAIVVTYNRKKLLIKCLNSLIQQTRPPDSIIVIDNNSTDGTADFVKSQFQRSLVPVNVISLPNNSGGAGGFSTGLSYAYNSGFSLMWIMDDDAFPEPEALHNLLKFAVNSSYLYGSTAINGPLLSWGLTKIDTYSKQPIKLESYSDLTSDSTTVTFLPFLGLLISKEIVSDIGFPDKSLFIAADDVEYCLRAQKNGHKVKIVRSSILHHPSSSSYELNLIYRHLTCLRLAPWKRYYDVRNRILISKKYYGMRFYFSTIPATFLRFIGCLIYEDKQLNQLKAFIAGFIDGIMNKRGCRHKKWNL